MIAKVFSLSFLGIGTFLILQIALPVISFTFWEKVQDYSNQLLISPQPIRGSYVLGVSIENKDNFPKFISTSQRTTPATYSQFLISVPSIKVENFKVVVDSNELKENLAHLPGSALPGETGNVFVSGHSAIPSFSGIKNIPFAKLPQVKKGDKIEVFAKGVTYEYQVIDMKVVDPTDISVISPPDIFGKYLTLMTCVPPGLNTKRLIILAKII